MIFKEITIPKGNKNNSQNWKLTVETVANQLNLINAFFKKEQKSIEEKAKKLNVSVKITLKTDLDDLLGEIKSQTVRKNASDFKTENCKSFVDNYNNLKKNFDLDVIFLNTEKEKLGIEEKEQEEDKKLKYDDLDQEFKFRHWGKVRAEILSCFNGVDKSHVTHGANFDKPQTLKQIIDNIIDGLIKANTPEEKMTKILDALNEKYDYTR